MGMVVEQVTPGPEYRQYAESSLTKMQPKAVGGGFWRFLGRGAAAKYGRENGCMKATLLSEVSGEGWAILFQYY